MIILIVALSDLITTETFGFIAPKTLKLFGIPIFRF